MTIRNLLSFAMTLLIAFQLQACGDGDSNNNSDSETSEAIASENAEVPTSLAGNEYNSETTGNTESTTSDFEPCNNGGTVKIEKGHKAYVNYNSILKKFASIERMMQGGSTQSALDQLEGVKRSIKNLLNKEPNADLTEVCSKLSSLEGGANKGAADGAMYAKARSVLGRYYAPAGTPPMPQRYNFVGGTFAKDIEGLDRKALISGAASSNNRDAADVKQKLEDYGAFIDRNNIVDYLMQNIDFAKASPGDEANQRIAEIRDVANGLIELSGGHDGLQSVVAYANKITGTNDAKMAKLYTGEFHKKNVGKVVFTKKPYKPGNESSVEINPTFEAGDAIYATVYLNKTIGEAARVWTQSERKGLMELQVMDKSFQLLDRRFEKWEVEGYADKSVVISPNINKSQAYIQFVLLPNMQADMSEAIQWGNFTPIHMARGASNEGERLKEYNVTIKGNGTYKGSFKLDLSKGNGGAEYYKKVENKLIDKIVAETPLPRAQMSEPALERELLAQMNAQGWDEQFKKAYIQTGWQVYKPLGQTPYRQRKVTFTYKTADGRCGWQTFTFRSLQSGSGWSKPQKWGGSDQVARVSCNKI